MTWTFSLTKNYEASGTVGDTGSYLNKGKYTCLLFTGAVHRDNVIKEFHTTDFLLFLEPQVCFNFQNNVAESKFIQRETLLIFDQLRVKMKRGLFCRRRSEELRAPFHLPWHGADWKWLTFSFHLSLVLLQVWQQVRELRSAPNS